MATQSTRNMGSLLHSSYIVNTGKHIEHMKVFNVDESKACVGDKLYCFMYDDNIIITNNAVRIPTGYNTIGQLEYKVDDGKLDKLYKDLKVVKVITGRKYKYYVWKGLEYNNVTYIIHPKGEQVDITNDEIKNFKQEFMMEKKSIYSGSNNSLAEFSLQNKVNTGIVIPLIGTQVDRIGLIAKHSLRYFEVNGMIIECNNACYTRHTFKGMGKKLVGKKLSKRSTLYSIWNGDRTPDISYLDPSYVLPQDVLSRFLRQFEVEKEFCYKPQIENVDPSQTQGTVSQSNDKTSQKDMFTFDLGDSTIRVEKFNHGKKQTLLTSGLIFVIETDNFILVANNCKIKSNILTQVKSRPIGKAHTPVKTARLINVFDFIRDTYCNSDRNSHQSGKRVIEYIHKNGVTPQIVKSNIKYATKGFTKYICSLCRNIVDTISCTHEYKCIKCCTYADTSIQCTTCFPGVRNPVKGCYYDYKTKRWAAIAICSSCRTDPATELKSTLCEPCYRAPNRMCSECGTQFPVTRMYSTKCKACYYS